MSTNANAPCATPSAGATNCSPSANNTCSKTSPSSGPAPRWTPSQPLCGARSEDWEWLDDLDSLVGHSLIDRPETSSESRFVLLETIREFAAERLEDRGATAVVSERHLAWFLELAEQAAENLKTVDQGTWLAVLDRERDNLRGAISWATRTGDTERASRLVLALWRYWHMRGPIAEGASSVRVKYCEWRGSPMTTASAHWRLLGDWRGG